MGNPRLLCASICCSAIATEHSIGHQRKVLAVLGIGALLVFPNQASAQSFMVGLSFSGLEWFLPLIIPVMIAFVSFQATKAAAFRTLRGMP